MIIKPVKADYVYFAIYNTEDNDFVSLAPSGRGEIQHARRFSTIESAREYRARLHPFNYRIFEIHAHYDFQEVK